MQWTTGAVDPDNGLPESIKNLQAIIDLLRQAGVNVETSVKPLLFNHFLREPLLLVDFLSVLHFH